MSEADFQVYTELLGNILKFIRYVFPILGVFLFLDLKKWKQDRLRWSLAGVCGALLGAAFFHIGYLLGTALSQFLSDHIIENLDYSKPTVLSEMYRELLISWVISCVLYYVFPALMLLLSRLVLKRKFPVTLPEAGALSVLNIVTMILIRFLIRLTIVPLENEVFVLNEQFRGVEWIYISVGILLFLGETALLYIWQRNRVLQEKEEQLLFLKMQTENLRKRVTENEAEEKRLRAFRHDFRNHVATLYGLLDTRSYEEAKKYLNSMETDILLPGHAISTGNTLLDVIVNDKAAEAESLGVTFAAEAFCNDLPEEMLYDLGILFMNLLDNGIHAAAASGEEEPFVFLRTEKKGDFFLILVKNSCGEKLLFDPSTGLPLRKNQSSSPGLGTKNIAEICERYFGTVKYVQKSGVVEARAMVQTTPGNFFG